MDQNTCIMIKLQNVWSEMMQPKNTDLSGDAFYNNSGYRCDGATLRVIERALRMIQAGQGSDLFLRQSRLIGRLKERQRKKDEGRNNSENIHFYEETVLLMKGVLLKQTNKQTTKASMRLTETSSPEVVWNQKSG